jgi:phosphonate degradation associated HDIG domain protein
MSTEIVDRIFDMLETAGSARYGQEAVNQRQHALQCAALAEAEKAGAALIAAALLHDIGHLLHGDETAALRGLDMAHEELGNAWLAAHFGPEVCDPVRLHVDAKRYLCHANPDYFATLSPASVRSLELQGGAFSPAEADAFLERPHARQAVRLRLWDDRAKDPDLETPPLAHFRPYVERALAGEG